MRSYAWSRYFVLFMGISFLGWAVETVFFYLYYGVYWDRGFMTMPFCTIYGFSFLLLYFLIGTPEAGRGGVLPRRQIGQRRNALVYLLLSALIPTALELVTGMFFDSVMGLRLWSYSAQRFHFRGYICLEYTMLWGALVPLSMRYVFAPMKRLVFRADGRRIHRLAAALALLAAVDWTYHFTLRA